MTPTYHGCPDRKEGFDMAAGLFRKNGGKLIVETGCMWEPSQGSSTYWLAKLAEEVGGMFASIDNNPEHVSFARESVNPSFPMAIIHCGDSIDELGSRLLTGKIDLLYLDAFDYDAAHPNLLGIYNVAELGACLGKMAEHSVILLDDWNWGEGEWRKCALSRELLLYRGWKLVMENYQCLFSR